MPAKTCKLLIAANRQELEVHGTLCFLVPAIIAI